MIKYKCFQILMVMVPTLMIGWFMCEVVIGYMEFVKNNRPQDSYVPDIVSIMDSSMASKLETGPQLSPRKENSSGRNQLMLVSQFQQAQVDKFCQDYQHNETDKKRTKLSLEKILLYDDAKTVFCFVPKVGCTTLKVIFFSAQGAIPKQKDTHPPSQGALQGAVNRHSLAVKNETYREKIKKTYYKFMMYRNPVDRLLSAYRDKVEKIPLFGLDPNEPERNWINMYVFKFKHPEAFQTWKDRGANISIQINFTDFIDYWIHINGSSHDDHFMPIIDLCNPCSMRYDYYGEFNRFKEDSSILMKKIGANSSLLADYHSSADSGEMYRLALKYYSQLSVEQKIKIIDVLAEDLCFYYTIFPREKDKHKFIMDIDYDIPCITS